MDQRGKLKELLECYPAGEALALGTFYWAMVEGELDRQAAARV